VIIRNDELYAAQATGCQGPHDVLPERLCFGFAGDKAEDFARAVGIGPDSHYRSGGDTLSAPPVLDGCGIDPHTRPLACDGPVQECLHM
jgi:hypothetical protein